jgi:tetratricopeptide (TPR) repeat protein
MEVENQDANSCKEAGNAHFAQQRFLEALQCYEQVLHSPVADTELKATAHSNRAACFFELGDYTQCVRECEAALALSQSLAAKAYARLAKSYYYLNQHEEAMKYVRLFEETKQVDPAIAKISQFLAAGVFLSFFSFHVFFFFSHVTFSIVLFSHSRRGCSSL